jgi:hypothetical protein
MPERKLILAMLVMAVLGGAAGGLSLAWWSGALGADKLAADLDCETVIREQEMGYRVDLNHVVRCHLDNR